MRRAADVVFINCTGETFTPGHSGAISTWMYEMCRAAELDGFTPLIITRSSPHPQYDHPNTIFLDYPRIKWGRVMRKMLTLQERWAGWAHPRHKAWCLKVADAIRKSGAEHVPLVLSNDIELAVWLRAWFPKAFIVHHAQNHNPSPPRFRGRFAQSVDAPLACSNFTARWNEDYFGLPSGAIKTLYNGVDVEAFHPRGSGESASLVVNFVGKTDPIKGPDLLLKAALEVTARARKFAIQIVGRKFYDRDHEDEYQRELRSLSSELKQRSIDVRFTGWVNRRNLPEVLRHADIHVTPSRWDEPFGMTTAESMASGMATIGSRTGGTPEVIGGAGLAV